jgi:hypothetical protein
LFKGTPRAVPDNFFHDSNPLLPKVYRRRRPRPAPAPPFRRDPSPPRPAYPLSRSISSGGSYSLALWEAPPGCKCAPPWGAPVAACVPWPRVNLGGGHLLPLPSPHWRRNSPTPSHPKTVHATTRSGQRGSIDDDFGRIAVAPPPLLYLRRSGGPLARDWGGALLPRPPGGAPTTTTPSSEI